MRCKNCGAEMSDYHVFCTNCGKPLDMGSEPPVQHHAPTPEPIPKPVPAPEPIPEHGFAPAPDPAEAPVVSGGGGGKAGTGIVRPLIIALIALMSAAVVLLLILVLRGGRHTGASDVPALAEDVTTQQPVQSAEPEADAGDSDREPITIDGPSTTAQLSDLLDQMGYVGENRLCGITASQAKDMIREIRLHCSAKPVVRAAIFDGGAGVPVLWIAEGDRFDESRSAFSGPSEDKIYGFSGGSLHEYGWITTVLNAGHDCVVAKRNLDNTKIDFYFMASGVMDEEPFAAGVWDHDGSAEINGVFIGKGRDVGLVDFYEVIGDAVGFRIAPQLEAVTEDDQLHLYGLWVDGQTMCDLLAEYAQIVQ